MDIDNIIEELKAEGWWLENHFYRNNKDFLEAFAKKLESKQLALTGVVQAKPEKFCTCDWISKQKPIDKNTYYTCKHCDLKL